MYGSYRMDVCDFPADYAANFKQMAIYLDCNATTPLDPRVAEEVAKFTVEEFGNAGSRTHSFGSRAKKRVQEARTQIAELGAVDSGDVVFTSGATEGNNLAILGLRDFGESEGRRHIVSTAIEHKAVLEPLEYLESVGFEVDLVKPSESGRVEPEEVLAAVRPNTLLISVMQVNNETGIIQPITEVADQLDGHPAFLHVDAAQGFGKDLEQLLNPRIDLISISGHKIYGPKGIGALLLRRRDGERPPLRPLMFGGGQEKGLRPGTLPVGLIAGLGEAAQLASTEHAARTEALLNHHQLAIESLGAMGANFNGDPELALPTTVNFSLPGLDSEAAIVALKDVAAVSNGSACTSQSYEPSHVLLAMDLDDERISGAIRASWSHMTPEIDWGGISEAVSIFRV
jgi:cysteine desulfurase